MPELPTKPTPAALTPAKAEKKAAPRDAVREALETVVFVVVLVFLLKQFVVEAFVIPTGSMAETLYGYQKNVTCKECGYQFPLNSSIEVDPQDERDRRPVMGYCCPNCRYKHEYSREDLAAGKVPGNTSGDRVLVHKAQYHVFDPTRGDVVVFKYPEAPQKSLGAQNYIKRMWGLGGETVAIWRGDLYVTSDVQYPADLRDDTGQVLYPPPPRPEDAWKGNPSFAPPDYRYPNAAEAKNMFRTSRQMGFPAAGVGFKLIRKSDALVGSMKRIVYDNDHPSNNLTLRGVAPRWRPEGADWTPDNAAAPKAFTHAGDGLGWVRYHHEAPDDWAALAGPDRPAVRPGVVENFLGYNAEVGGGRFVLDRGSEDHRFWVGDLIVECRAQVTDPTAEVVLELSKGHNRFQAKFAGGQVTLTRTGPDGKEMATRPTRLTGPGTYDLGFANVDSRLRVWVDGRAIDFGGAADYSPHVPDRYDPADLKHEGWTTENDVAGPAGVGATGGVAVSRLKVWRDSYFINTPYSQTTHATEAFWTFYVQPGHYLCLGDNSAQSSDGRAWGVVPERLLLGRASFIFFPLDRIGFIK